MLADLLHVDFPRQARFAVVSNTPFALTARLLRRLQTLPNPPSDAWLVMQEEAPKVGRSGVRNASLSAAAGAL
jgi:16S rRNA A1518/A1519 N6-dimethyltransferase RsmA/KsgA/DIM1 with predicted DNA glycosylase/AP lyase activity